jgi:hypothetical protein
MFLTSPLFDKAIIYMIRSMAKHFLLKYRDRSLNEIPLDVAIMADADTLDLYIDKILMSMGTDA